MTLLKLYNSYEKEKFINYEGLFFVLFIEKENRLSKI